MDSNHISFNDSHGKTAMIETNVSLSQKLLNMYYYKLSLILAFLLYSFHSLSQTIDQRLKELELTLPEVETPVATYLKWKQVDNLLYISGTGSDIFGKVGSDLTVDEGYQAARSAGLQIIAVLQASTGDLTKINQFVKVLGMVNSDPGFSEQSMVINGFSDLIVEVFGDKGKHTRSAIGVAALPNNIAVEIEVIVELKKQ
ncbi:RidA family protein [Algoriphagus sp. NG3]|uniref:RidA family protein n=1 Tax=Algoriphagus sp. NG3 TaxID=3097546 RepID=UPI002A80ED2A|nr:RidA family protein [Algoriphagus sp. NG3]WPR77271.1 RidA family protein [Algoriphagus sp. NG3]